MFMPIAHFLSLISSAQKTTSRSHFFLLFGGGEETRWQPSQLSIAGAYKM